MPFSNFHYFESVTPIFLIFFAYASFICIFFLMCDCTQGKKVTCLRGFTIFLGWRYFLDCRWYQTILPRGLGAAPGL